MEHLAELHLRAIQYPQSFRGEVLPTPVDLKIEHRHGRAKRRRLTPATGLRGTHQRQRHLLGTPPFEDALLKIESIASLHNACRPASRRLGLTVTSCLFGRRAFHAFCDSFCSHVSPRSGTSARFTRARRLAR